MIGRRSVTQADVAKAAGVSTASVSRVLNGSDLVKPEVRARIEAAIEELNYVPHNAARALALRRSRILGAILPTLNNAIFAEGINAFERAARDRGYTLVLTVSNYDLDEELNLVRKMIERGVDGLMLIGNDHREEAYERLRKSEVRHLCAWTHLDAAPAPNVGFSNADAMVELVDHLVALGHRKIAMLAGITEGNDRARERLAGVRARLAHHGLALPKSRVIEIPYSIREARAAFPRLVAKGPTAVICGNDVIAIGALLEAQKMGLRIPAEVSLTGFDNLTLSGEFLPSITTINVPAVAMGTAAADALIDAIESDADVAGCALETRLLIRGTTGRAPS